MDWMLYFRLFLLTAGTLLPFFWMIVILGHRRQRNFERLFFFLCLALTCFFGSSLLVLNAQLHYETPSKGLALFSWTFICLGLWMVPPLLIHLHVEYASLREILQGGMTKAGWIAAGYLPAVALSPILWNVLRDRDARNFTSPSYALGISFRAWLIASLLVACYWQRRFGKAAPDEEQRSFHRLVVWTVGALIAILATAFLSQFKYGPNAGRELDSIGLLFSLAPLSVLILHVQRFNFLQIGRQRNLIYAVFAVFIALLYLTFVRKIGLWLEPYFPPEATAALLLFLPVVFFEPLQRMIRAHLLQTAQGEVDRAQKIMTPITEMARLGDLRRLSVFIESWVAEQLQLAEVKLEWKEDRVPRYEVGAKSGSEETFPIARTGHYFGRLRVRPHGAMISGETYAALELICEQLPGAFDLCRLIEEKLQLERELAERERLALVGQMAASISHNLKNPLGSIKTILQVQMESAELPESLRGETQMVLEEINRLSAKLNQLLQFSRPGVRHGVGPQCCSLAAVAESVLSVLRHTAEERGIVLRSTIASSEVLVAMSEEAANDVLSNVLLNAIEAVSDGGEVSLWQECSAESCTLIVEDDGPGIPATEKSKVLQPFFTTKARGTGLGLAIVDRKLQEAGGSFEIESPVKDGRGTRIRLRFPVAAKERVE